MNVTKAKRTSVTPSFEAQIIALREAGYTNLAIAKRLGLGLRTVQRHLASAGIKKGGLKSELIDQARDEALSLLRSDPAIKQAISELLLDDIAHVSHLRDVMVQASEHLIATDAKSASIVMRATAAYSVALKNTSDTLQKHFSKHSQSGMQEMPELIVREITAEEAMQMTQRGMVEDECDANDELSIPSGLDEH